MGLDPARPGIAIIFIQYLIIISFTQAACFNEVKLGLFAQSCLAPGFSTIMANLLVASEEQATNKKMCQWRQMYLPTTNKVILAETLSPTFAGYLFGDVASILFTRSDTIHYPGIQNSNN